MRIVRISTRIVSDISKLTKNSTSEIKKHGTQFYKFYFWTIMGKFENILDITNSLEDDANRQH
ncbi:MAG: hypothetical protein WBE68_10965 [Candidatus Nitrosopolaris sp.]